jgi:hypothetical protein
VVRKTFKWPQHIFALLWLSPLWKGPHPLYENNEIPRAKDILYQDGKLNWNWLAGYNFFCFCNCTFSYYLPLERGVFLLYTLGGWFVTMISTDNGDKLLQRQICYDSKIIGNEHGCCNEGWLYMPIFHTDHRKPTDILNSYLSHILKRITKKTMEINWSMYSPCGLVTFEF